jgi:hypothetical protein
MKATNIKDELLGEISVAETTIARTESYNTIDFDTLDTLIIVENYVLEKHGIKADTISIRNGVITVKF